MKDSSNKEGAGTPGTGMKPSVAACIVGAVTLALYLLTMNRTFGFVDGGELAAVASTWGIAHPTGYPTATLLGYLVQLVLPVRSVVALNIMAALFTAASAGCMVLLFHRVIAYIRTSKKGGVAKHHDTSKDIWLAAGGALVVATGTTWWGQGTAFEVYALHTFFLVAVAWLFLNYVSLLVQATQKGANVIDDRSIRKCSRVFGLGLGLAFTNHMTMVLVFPAFLLFYLLEIGWNKVAVRGAFRVVPWFLLGLLPYVLLPIRSATEPFFDWGSPDTYARFIDHVSGAMFRHVMFAGGDTFGQQTSYFFSLFPTELAYGGLVVAGIGLVWLIVQRWKLALWCVVLFATTVIYAGGYEILDIDSYYLAAFLAIGVWLVAGFIFLADTLGLKVGLGIATALILATVILHYPAMDASKSSWAEDMAVNMLQTLPQNALILSPQWDVWVSGSYYLQAVEKVRPDITVINTKLIPFSWHLEQMQRTMPEVMGKVQAETERLRQVALRRERGEPVRPAEFQYLYLQFVNAIVDRNILHRPVYVTGDIEPAVGGKYARVPNYLALRLVPGERYVTQEFPAYRITAPENTVGLYQAKIYELYGRSLFARGLYESGHGKDSLAREYFHYALKFDPQYRLDNVSDFPLNGEEQIRATAMFFRQLREQASARGVR